MQQRHRAVQSPGHSYTDAFSASLHRMPNQSQFSVWTPADTIRRLGLE